AAGWRGRRRGERPAGEPPGRARHAVRAPRPSGPAPGEGSPSMTVPTVDAALHARLQHLAAEVRAGAVCAVCADSPAAPCGACAERRARVAALNRARAPLAVIAADVALPAWRVARILREQRLGDDAGAERAANARLPVAQLRQRLPARLTGATSL